MHIKMMRAGNVAKHGAAPTVMQVMAEPPDKNEQSSNTLSTSQSRVYTPAMEDAQGLMGVQSKNLTEVTKALSEKQDTSQKAIANLTTQIVNFVNLAEYSSDQEQG